MDETLDELYEKYLNERLDLVLTLVDSDCRNSVYNLIDENNIICGTLKVVKKGNKYNLMICESGEMIFDEYHSHIEALSFGFFILKDSNESTIVPVDDDKCVLTNQNGKKILELENDDIGAGYNTKKKNIVLNISDNGKRKLINLDGTNATKYKRHIEYPSRHHRLYPICSVNCFDILEYFPVDYNKKVNCIMCGDAIIKLLPNYYPSSIFGNGKYVLCRDEDYNEFVYDVEKSEYIKIPKYDDGLVEYNETNYYSSMFTNNGHTFMAYDHKLIDVTYYTFKKVRENGYLIDSRFDSYGEQYYFKINPGIEIVDKDLFYLLNKEQISELFKKNEEEKRRQEEKNSIEKLRLEAEEKERKAENDRQEAINKISEGLATLNNNYDTEKTKRIKVNNLFDENVDYKQIDILYDSVLRYIDLSTENFKNVKVSGINFKDTNINAFILNPQEVYKKDLSGCDFTNVNMFAVADIFDGVDIRGAKFGNSDKSFKNIPNFKNAIYDETTTFNGISLYELIGECKNLPKDDNKKQM